MRAWTLPALVLTLVFAMPGWFATPAMAQVAQAPAPAEASPAEPALSADEAGRLLAEVLRDPEARAALIDRLEAGAVAVPGADGAATAEAAAPDLPITQAVADKTLEIAEGLSETAIEIVAAVTSVEAIQGRLARVDWQRVADDAAAVGIVMAVTLGMFWLLRQITRPLRDRFTRYTDGEGALPFGRRLARLARIGVFELLMIVLAWGVGYALALWGVGMSGEMDGRQSLFLNAFLVVELGRLVLRLVLAPNRPALRITGMTDAAAQEWYRRPARILVLLGYGMLLAVPVARQNLPRDYSEALALAIVIAASFMAIRLILRNRTAVASALDARAARIGTAGLTSGVLAVLARIWHLLAIGYVFGLFLVWSARPVDALGYMLGATLQSLAAIIVGTAAMVAITRRIAGGIQLSGGIKDRLPMLESRLNALVPNALAALRIILFFAVIGIVLQIWGVFSLGDWLTGPTGARFVQGLVSAGLILFVCAAIWIAIASWIEYKITPPDGRLVRPRERTLLTLLRNALTVVIAVMAGMLTLSALGLNIAPLLAGAGVIGLAIGFGAQRMVQDIITGVFIQFENAMNAGDVVTAGGITGVVEKLTIRSVGLRDVSGTFHVVPFSSVDAVSNFTKDFAYHVADIGIAYREDVGRAMELMQEAYDELRASEAGQAVIGGFDNWGVQELGDSAVVLRGRIMTRPGDQWSVGRAYNAIVKHRFDEAGVEIPYPHLTLYMGQDRDGGAPPINVRMLGESAASAARAPLARTGSAG
jgi:small conductance mechanosensitive channel